MSAILIVLAVGYLAQLVTPLRLHPDTVVLLSIADAAAHGEGFLFYGHPTVFPPAYPALVVLLLKLHIAHPWVLVAINFVFLFGGLYALRKILLQSFFADSGAVLGICILSLLSFVVIRHFTIPLTDIGFFGLAMCALAAMESASRSDWGRSFLFGTMTATGFVILAVAQRWVGLALIPALLWTVAAHTDVRRKATMLVLNWRVVLRVVIILGVIGIPLFYAVESRSTLNDFRRVWAFHASGEVEAAIPPTRAKELAEIALNLPQAALPAGMRPALAPIGVSFSALVLFGMVLKRRQFGPTDAFFIAYVVVLFMWPFYDPRFWIPVIPFLIAYAGLAVKHLTFIIPWSRQMAAAYLAVYAGLGILVLVASTQVAFSGSKFPDAYANDLYRGTYCAVFRSCGEDRSAVDDAALHVLQTYR